MGYITKGYGITIHRMVCPNVKELDERFVDVRWNDEITKRYPTTIMVYTISKKDVLLDIVSKASNNSVSIESINSMVSNSENTYEITVVVDNKDELVKFMSDIKSIPEVRDVERKIL